MRDYYSILGVAEGATLREIKEAYRKKAKEWHPDVCSRKDAHSQFILISEAYEILKDEESRREYNRIRHMSFNQEASESFRGYQRYARQRGEEYSKSSLEDILNVIYAEMSKAGKTFVHGEVPKNQIPTSYYLSTGFHLFIITILILLTFTGVLAIATVPLGFWVLHLLYNKNRQYLGVSNLFKSFVYVTIPIFLFLFWIFYQLMRSARGF